jgi:myo-inositol-1(or 4)-monophosphatase
MIRSMDYRTFIKQQLLAAAKTAEQYFGNISSTVKPGDSNQVVTEADVAIGKQIIAGIQATYPDHNIIDEEAGVIDNGSEFTWVIDPIEATSNFAAGLPQYGIMVGLLQRATPFAGGVIAPAYNKLYLAEKGQGTTCNGNLIHVTAETDSLNTLVSFGIDSHRENPELTIRQCRVLADIILHVRNIRNTGCGALDPMYVAEGRYGASISTTSKIWDNVAPHIIATEAGALYTGASGSPIDYSNPLSRVDHNFSCCTASPALHAQLQEIIAGRL